MTESQRLREQLQTIAKLGSALAVLSWDEEVNLPPKAHAYRGEVSALLSAEIHRKFTSDEFVKLARKLNSDSQSLSADDRVNAEETWRDVSRAQKLPVKFVEDLTRLTSEAFGAWAEARKQKDFKIYEPVLKRMVDMKRQEAELIGFKVSPYDALLDEFEPGMTSAQLDKLFSPIAKNLSALIKQAKNKKQQSLPKAFYELGAQTKLCHEVSETLGYDFDTGRIDASPHPFTTSFHQTDVRVTTRYDEADFWVSLGSTIHEIGHALYEQGLPAEHFGTPLGQAISLGVHESQSRMWENFVGRSREFSEYLYPLLKKYFPDQKLKFTSRELHLWLNRVKPNLIRVESDEVTYNLHIILRYEIEKQLVEGRLKVSELPAVWNQKMKDYLGLDVPDDAQGVLQDVHWAHGAIGYFPTYSLGNLYAAQLYNTVSQKIPGLAKGFSSGDFAKLLGWLRQNIHAEGRRYKPAELLEKLTGEPPNPAYLQEHLERVIKLG
ncbi:carboxypeptidase M32 [Candidatus Saccharibacteria bacterium]|nr:carboxypeptidase M32 [Candidatus Saccharibacteria bacterium]